MHLRKQVCGMTIPQIILDRAIETSPQTRGARIAGQIAVKMPIFIEAVYFGFTSEYKKVSIFDIVAQFSRR